MTGHDGMDELVTASAGLYPHAGDDPNCPCAQSDHDASCRFAPRRTHIDVSLTAWERKTIIHALGKLRDRKRDYRTWLQTSQPNNTATADEVTAATLRIEALLVRLIEINRGRPCPDLCPTCGGTCIHCDLNSTCPGVHLVAPAGGGAVSSMTPREKQIVRDLHELLAEANAKGKRVVSVKSIQRVLAEYARDWFGESSGVDGD